jgi:hypothetical protein
MRNQVGTLNLAFKEAHDNGWRLPQYGEQLPTAIEGVDYSSIIYSHDFAKALWGLDRLVCDSCHVDVEQNDKTCWNCNNKTFAYEAYQNTRDNHPNWQYHLREMVIAENPLEYLSAALPGVGQGGAPGSSPSAVDAPAQGREADNRGESAHPKEEER